MKNLVLLLVFSICWVGLSFGQKTKTFNNQNILLNYPRHWISFNCNKESSKELLVAIAPKKEIRDVVIISSDIPYQKKQELKKSLADKNVGFNVDEQFALVYFKVLKIQNQPLTTKEFAEKIYLEISELKGVSEIIKPTILSDNEFVIQYQCKIDYPQSPYLLHVKRHFYLKKDVWFDSQTAWNDKNKNEYFNELFQIEQSLHFNR